MGSFEECEYGSAPDVQTLLDEYEGMLRVAADELGRSHDTRGSLVDDMVVARRASVQKLVMPLTRLHKERQQYDQQKLTGSRFGTSAFRMGLQVNSTRQTIATQHAKPSRDLTFGHSLSHPLRQIHLRRTTARGSRVRADPTTFTRFGTTSKASTSTSTKSSLHSRRRTARPRYGTTWRR